MSSGTLCALDLWCDHNALCGIFNKVLNNLMCCWSSFLYFFFPSRLWCICLCWKKKARESVHQSESLVAITTDTDWGPECSPAEVGCRPTVNAGTLKTRSGCSRSPGAPLRQLLLFSGLMSAADETECLMFSHIKKPINHLINVSLGHMIKANTTKTLLQVLALIVFVSKRLPEIIINL